MSIMNRYAGYLDTIEENILAKMTYSNDITYTNFVHWAEHIASLKNRYVIGLNITESTSSKGRKDLRRILGTFAADCNKIFAYAEEKDAELKEV